MATTLLGSGSASTALRRIVLFGFVLLFIVLILNVSVQYKLAWEDLNRNLESSLVTEGRILTAGLVRALDPIPSLDPFYEEWRVSSSPSPWERLTGSNWLLLDASGEIAIDSSGAPLFRKIDPATAEIDYREERNLIRLAAHSEEGQEVFSDLHLEAGTLSKRVYLPVWVAPEIYETPWVLVGQAGEGYFSELFAKQQWFWWTASLLTVGSLGFLLLLVRGIVRTEKYEGMLRNSEELMELESLTSTLAHELRNPLSIVRSSAEILLRDESLTEDGRELVSDVIEEVGRTQDVLSRHLHPERDSFEGIRDICGFARDFWKRRESHLENNRFELEISHPPGEGPIGVSAVQDQLEQILDNLLRNSMEAMPGGGKLRFEVLESVEGVTLRFSDNGPGLNRNSPFRKDGWRMGGGKQEGRGIGLRLARRWVERWGGSLEIRNLKEGWFGPVKGAEILIRLPRSGRS